MKEFTVKVVRTVVCQKTFSVRTETAEQAVNSAYELAHADDWKGAECSIKYNVGFAEEVPNNYIDKYGNPYDSEDEHACWPAGGGLHKDCEFNADALYAYYTLGDRDKIEEYLFSKGFLRVECYEHYEQWVKGNTEITYEDYDNSGHLWGYMHTELIDED